MRKLLLKLVLYSILFAIVLECLVRIFYLGQDKPVRYLDSNNVEKWVPNQNGYAITGNRNQNFVKYNINQSGFNSYREFKPTKDGVEVALIGDSFVEGFHQPYARSTGRLVELMMNNTVDVFEYGYSGYDMADQLHLLKAYEKDFQLIDYVYIKLKFSNDLRRPKYEVMTARLNMESPLNNLLKKSKLLIYLTDIGFVDPVKDFVRNLASLRKKKKKNNPEMSTIDKDKLYIDNFNKLIEIYGYDKQKYVLLMDEEDTSVMFVDYLNRNDFRYLDFGKKINYSSKPTTLIYDMHWNEYGRKLIAEIISDDLKNKEHLN